MPLLALGGCGLEQLLFSQPPAPPPPEPLPPSRGNAAQADVSAGLSALPTPQQVLTAVPFGRTDPFAPVVAVPAQGAAPGSSPAVAGTAASPASLASPIRAAAAATAPGSPAATPSSGPAAASSAAGAAAPARPMPLRPPADFRLTGVIHSGGRAEALVSYGAASGSLRPGDRGGRTTGLLPAGWALAGILFGGRSPADPPSILLLHAGQLVKVSL